MMHISLKVLFTILIYFEFAFLRANGEVVYEAEFSEDFKSCKDFDNKRIRCESFILGLVEGDDDAEGGIGVSGVMEISQNIDKGYKISLEVWKLMEVGKEFTFASVTDVCESLKSEEAPWYPLVVSMNVSDCPVPAQQKFGCGDYEPPAKLQCGGTGGGGAGEGLTKFSVEIVQQLEFTTSAADSQPQQISTNVTVKALANAVKTSGSPPPPQPPRVPSPLDCERECKAECKSEVADDEFVGLDECAAALERDAASAFPGLADLIGEDDGDDTFEDLITEISEYPEFMKDFDLDAGKLNGGGGLANSLEPNEGEAARPYNGGEMSPAAQTLKHMAEQHQQAAGGDWSRYRGYSGYRPRPQQPTMDHLHMSQQQQLHLTQPHHNLQAMRGWCARWSGGGRGRLRWLAALLCWVALAAVALPRLQTPPTPRAAHAAPPAPPARLLLQSEAAASTPALVTPGLPATDTRVLTEEELRADAERRLPSLPLAYWHKHKDDKNKYYKKKDCAPFPSIYDLEFHNTYWQTLRASEGVFHLYGAYMDARNTSRIGPAVRVLTVHDRIKPTLATHCQLWFEEREAPVVVRNLEYKYVWNSKWGNYRDHVLQPYLLACVLPAEVRHLVPASVSIVENPCDRATNNLRVHYDRPVPPTPRKEFAVCVKGLDFLHEDLSVRLVEWIELVRILGADKIFFYELQVHPNITKVLDYYRAQGAVEVTPITLPGGQPNLPGLQHMYLKKKTTHKRQMELIPYNDCLYRHMYEYRWLALLDIDEVIVPLEDEDWSGLMRRVLPLAVPAAGKPARSSYHASNLYFLDSLRHEHGWEEGVPRYLHMLQHVYRTRNFTKPGQYVKAFHETERVLALHNHFPLACLGGACSSYALETRHARLQHYRADCVTALSKSCGELRAQPVRDTALWRWRGPLQERAERALRDLGFLPPHR